MLTQEIKKKIDSARDILVGKVPDPKAQVEQITTALIYKFMDDMDKQSAALPKGKAQFFANGYEKYAWTKMMDSRLGGQDRLNLYVEALTKMSKNPHLPQLFRDIFKDAFLPYRDPETLNLFLKEINGFAYDHSENLGDAFEYLLSILGSQGDAGQFRTPRHIIDFIVEVVDPKKDETILDPACGTAGFLISAYKHILKTNKNKPLTPDEKKRLMSNLAGYDISPDMVKLSLVNMYLHGFPSPNIHEYDTLTSEERWDERFDVMMANPPFMTPKGGIRPHKRFMVQANRSEVLFVDYIVEHLNNKGRAGIIVPEGIIFTAQTAYKQLRKLLLEDGLYAVVSLPAGVFNPYAGVKTSILFFDNELAKRSKDILFIKIQDDGFELGATRRPSQFNDLPHAIETIAEYKKYVLEENQKEINRVVSENGSLASIVKKTTIAESGDYNLSGDRYNQPAGLLNHKWEMVKLGDVCKILNGYAFKSENYTNNGTRVIRITNVQKGKIVDDDPKYYPLDTKEPVERYKLLENDLLISLTGNVGRVGLLSRELLPAALNQRVACLRANTEKIRNKFLYHVLNIETFENDCIASASGIAQKNLSTVWLSKYKIPLPPIEIQQQIMDELDGYQKVIEGAKQIVSNYKPLIKVESSWETIEIGSICNLVRGSSPRPQGDPRYYGGKVSRLMISDVTRDGMHVTPTTDFLTEKGAKLSRPMKKGEVVMAVSGNPGLPSILKVDACIHDGFVGFRELSKGVLPEFLYYVFLYQKVINNAQSIGAVFKNLTTDQIKKFKIPLPPVEIQRQVIDKLKDEQQEIDSAKSIIVRFEEKIQSKIAEVWGE